MAAGKSISKTAMWILMGLLILGLGGFGAVNLSGNIRSIGTVGEKTIPVDQYARQLSQEIRALEQQTGQSMPFARAQEIGLDRAVLQRIVRNRALDNETQAMGLSIGDRSLRDEILQISAFQGINGEFDREGYRYALQQGGVSEAEFETSLREEAARTLLQGAVLGGVKMPNTYAQTLVSFVGEARSFTWTTLDEANLETSIPRADDATLQAYYEANTERFMLPAAKKITYAWLTPDALLGEVEVAEETLRAEYDARSSQYNRPERRLVERLAFGDQEAADQAAAALEVGGTTFNALVEDRGLELADVDLGDVGRLELDAAGEAVFAADAGTVVGPLPSSLGPALYRVNGVLPAQNTSFEDAREELREELAIAGAVRAVEARAQDLDDQLAGGVTLEQLAEDDAITLGNIDWTVETAEGIAAYANFREVAATVTGDDFPKIEQLEDGGIFAIRLDEALPERPNPFDAAREDVRAAWRADQTVAALKTQADALVGTLGGDASFEDAGLEATVETDQTRNAFIPAAPEGLVARAFELTPGEVAILEGEETVAILRLDAITEATQNAENVTLQEQLGAQLDQALAQDLFNIYNDEIVRQAAPQVDQRALQAVHVNFP